VKRLYVSGLRLLEVLILRIKDAIWPRPDHEEELPLWSAVSETVNNNRVTVISSASASKNVRYLHAEQHKCVKYPTKVSPPCLLL
jgi:hypothetical protein